MYERGSYVLQFGSHGVDVYSSLRSARLSAEDEGFFAAVDQAIAEIADYLRPDAAGLAGFERDTWLLGDQAAGGGDSRASLSLVVIYHFWLCSQYQAKTGELCALTRGARAIIGHSVGLVSGCFAAFLSEERLRAIAQSAIKYVAVLSARSHQAYAAALRAQGHGQRGIPMLSVKGLEGARLRELMAAYQRRHPAASRFDIGIDNGPGFQVVSGSGPDIEGFASFLISDSGIAPEALSDLGFSSAFHCRQLDEVLERFEKDREFIGAGFLEGLPQAAVYANSDGANLGLCDDLYRELAREVCVAPVQWMKPVEAALAGLGTGRFVDFGPGPLVRIFSQACAKSLGKATEFQSIERLKNDKRVTV